MEDGLNSHCSLINSSGMYLLSAYPGSAIVSATPYTLNESTTSSAVTFGVFLYFVPFFGPGFFLTTGSGNSTSVSDGG